MFGLIIGYNDKTGTGLIQDSKRDVYLFDISSFQDEVSPYIGMSVYFELTKVGSIQSYTHYVVQVLPRFEYGA